ncbi:MAG TPA: SCO family protein [Tepidisphaeraceae bacterium]|nr:SCO family protein [Tepidisphaeraceae bacterium]
MNKPAKILAISLWSCCLIAIVGVATVLLLAHDRRENAALAIVPISTPSDGVPPPTFSAPDFSLTDQLGRTVTTASLRGHPFIVSFIFTTCAADCPLVSLRFSQLQSRIPKEVRFISITVDPDYDKPAVLLKYAEQYHADNDRWRFLTGPRDQVFAAIHGLKVAMERTGPNQIQHDLHYNLYDSEGRFRWQYSSKSPAEIDQLVKDVKALLAEEKGQGAVAASGDGG